MFDLDKCCQPGERITIVTKNTVIVGVIPETYGSFRSPEEWAAQALGPLTDKIRLHLHALGFPGCASGVGIEVQVVRARGQD